MKSLICSLLSFVFLTQLCSADISEPTDVFNPAEVNPLESLTVDNMPIILNAHLLLFEKEAKRFKPLVIAFMSRHSNGDGGLEFSR